MIPFAGEFHARSAFSFLRGASQPEVMIQRAIAMGYETIAITDDLGFYGSARAHKAAEDTDLKVVVGASLEISPGCFIPVLCASQKGYQLLSGHLTDRHLKDRDPEVFRSETGLIALTGDREGPVCRPLLRNDKAGALAAVESLMQIFGRENLYVELNRHGLRDDGLLNRQLIDLAKHFRLPLLACNAPIQSVRADRSLADAFTCLRHHVSLDQAGKLLAINGERHLKSAAGMSRLFADLPEALLNTHRLKDRIGYSLENLGYRFPDFPDEQGKPLSMVEQTKLLRELSIAGAKRLGSWDAKFEVQIEKEIDLIHQLGFSGYFLIVHEIVWFARDRDIFCQGRGSAANSAVCYALGITRFDPVKNHLLFERFLSANSKSWPDIDIDFPSGEKRELVIQHVFQKYGARGAAMTANIITYRPRSAFREMSKVLSFPPSLADRFSLHGHGFHGDEKEEDEKPEESAFEALVGNLIPPSHPRIKALGHLYESVLGMPRHLGQHSGGMIICDRGLDAVVPIQPATMANRTVVQWDKDDCEDLGIVKIDLLGLGILAAMENMLEIRSRRCPEKSLDLSTLPLTDPQVFELMTKADTIGTFQVESRAQMATLPIMRPKEFYDVAIEVAIIRPGPIVGDLMHPYLNRRRGRETPDYIVAKESEFYPEFRRILGRTLGVPMFQEQMLQMAMKIADFNGGEADQLRRAISFKRSDERMIKVTEKLRARMTAKDVPEDVQEKIIHSIGSFALYGFPESHALSFGWLAYISCWFKVNHSAEFYTGLINHQPMGFYSVHTLIQDAKHHGIRVLPVSCVHSGNFTDVEDDRTIRLGLHRLKGLRPSVRERLIFERQRRPFESLEDFLIRVRPNEKERRIFAESGALNDLPEGLHRRQALWQAELPLHGDLLDHQQGDEIQLTPMSISERLSSDVATQGASIGPHPMKLWREKSHLIVQRARDLPILPAKTPVTVAGLVICRQRPGTAKGHCFISLEDETGIANLFVKRETFEANRRLISSESFLTASGYVQISEGDQPTVFVTHLAPLSGLDPSHASESHDFH
jgi:error-prone DNA polymerase